MTLCYLIELDKWNIKEGIPSKPYKNLDYIQADQNIKGINNAIQYASSNNYTSICLPKGSYALCYPREIQMLSNITFDLNGSTLKVIYDSDKKSPFDSRSTTDYYKFVGNTILFENVSNSHVIGGTIIGCRDDRSFKNINEESKIENSYGVVFRKSTKYSSISHCIIRDYMGDNITFSSTAISEYQIPSTSLILSSLDYSTGQVISNSAKIITNYINIPNDRKYYSFQITGAGYSRLTTLNTRAIDIFFYSSDDSYIGVFKNQKIYTDISIPQHAKKFRLQFIDETDTSKNLQITLRYGLLPHHNKVEYNEIFNGHRGGITLGGSYNIIQYNTIRDNGKEINSFLDSKPKFPFSTRYSINQEDSFGDNCKVKDNLIYGSYHGILVGCYSIEINNNHFYNIPGVAINLYSMQFANITQNVIYKCDVPIGTMTSNFKNAYINFTENNIYGGGMSFSSNSSYKINIVNNNFVDIDFIDTGSVNYFTFKNNNLSFSLNKRVSLFIENIENCSFVASTINELDIRTRKIQECNFQNIQINLKTKLESTLAAKIYINECDFSNSIINNTIIGTKDREIFIRNSNFNDTLLKLGNINTPNSNAIMNINNSDFNFNTITQMIKTDFNQPFGTINIDNCRININNNTFLHLLYHEKEPTKVFKMNVSNSSFNFSGSSSLEINFYNKKNPMIFFIFKNTHFENIKLPVKNQNIDFNYDINETFKDKITLLPLNDYFSATIRHNLNTKEPHILCISDSAIIFPNILIIDSNTIEVKHNTDVNKINIIIKKL